MAYESPAYRIEERIGEIELRRYEPYVVHETLVSHRTCRGTTAPEPVRRSTDLRQLTLVFDAAEAAGAIDRLKTKVKVDPDWFELSAIEQAEAIIDEVLDLRPLPDAARS